MRNPDETAEKVRNYVNRQTFPVSIPEVADHLGVNHASATSTASYQIALGVWRRAEDGRVMGVNCQLPLDWTEDVNQHMDPSLLKKCMSERDSIDIWRTGAWLSTTDIHKLTGIPSRRIQAAFDSGRLPYRIILDRRHAAYYDVRAWAYGVD